MAAIGKDFSSTWSAITDDSGRDLFITDTFSEGKQDTSAEVRELFNLMASSFKDRANPFEKLYKREVVRRVSADTLISLWNLLSQGIITEEDLANSRATLKGSLVGSLANSNESEADMKYLLECADYLKSSSTYSNDIIKPEIEIGTRKYTNEDLINKELVRDQFAKDILLGKSAADVEKLLAKLTAISPEERAEIDRLKADKEANVRDIKIKQQAENSWDTNTDISKLSKENIQDYLAFIYDYMQKL